MSVFLNVLTLIFIAAKLFGVITWTWWLVLLPTLSIIIWNLILLLIIGVVTAIGVKLSEDD